MNNIIFIIGGSDSGKSIFAEKLALKLMKKVTLKKLHILQLPSMLIKK